MQPTQLTYTTGQAAKLVGRTRQYIYKEIRAGRLPYHRPYSEAEWAIFHEDLIRHQRGKYANGYRRQEG